MKFSIIIPAYNEGKTIQSILEKVSRLDFGINKEIIIIDDGSQDNSEEVIRNFLKKNRFPKTNYIFHKKKNGGKGSAVRKGIKLATGDIIVVQDADLEYNPREFRKLIKPIIEGRAVVVYGSRFLEKHKPLYKIYFLGNKFLTFLTKVLYGTKITDMETCYKVFKKEVIKNINLKANKFDMEPEITAKILKNKIKIHELSISYNPRSVKEGKKINWKDGLQAIWTLIYWRFKKT